MKQQKLSSKFESLLIFLLSLFLLRPKTSPLHCLNSHLYICESLLSSSSRTGMKKLNSYTTSLSFFIEQWGWSAMRKLCVFLVYFCDFPFHLCVYNDWCFISIFGSWFLSKQLPISWENCRRSCKESCVVQPLFGFRPH